MTEEAKELHRIISASVRDMLTEYRLQARPSPIYPDPTNVINPDDRVMFDLQRGVVARGFPIWLHFRPIPPVSSLDLPNAVDERPSRDV